MLKSLLLEDDRNGDIDSEVVPFEKASVCEEETLSLSVVGESRLFDRPRLFGTLEPVVDPGLSESPTNAKIDL